MPGDKQGEERVNQSTISRFACRILADRTNPRICRIYAAGFDSSRNIFLGVSESLYKGVLCGWGGRPTYLLIEYLDILKLGYKVVKRVCVVLWRLR